MQTSAIYLPLQIFKLFLVASCLVISLFNEGPTLRVVSTGYAISPLENRLYFLGPALIKCIVVPNNV